MTAHLDLVDAAARRLRSGEHRALRDAQRESLRAEKEARRQARFERRLLEANGHLDPGMRFRALQSTLKAETDFLDLADKKARFALIIMSVLNAVALVVVTKGGNELFPRHGAWGRVLQFEVVVYAAVTVYYIWKAIDALRPRGKLGRPTGTLPVGITHNESMRVLFHADIAARSREEYRALWSQLRLDNVNAELADQLHMVSCINVVKFEALRRLYQGVVVMPVLITLTLLTMGAHAMA